MWSAQFTGMLKAITYLLSVCWQWLGKTFSCLDVTCTVYWDAESNHLLTVCLLTITYLTRQNFKLPRWDLHSLLGRWKQSLTWQCLSKTLRCLDEICTVYWGVESGHLLTVCLLTLTCLSGPNFEVPSCYCDLHSLLGCWKQSPS